MSEPQRGQPFTPAPGLRFSIGDVFAPSGTVAYESILVGAPPFDVPPANIVPPGTPVTLTIFLRAADALGGVWLTPAVTSAIVNYHITNVETNTVVGTFPGGTISPSAPPSGASSPGPGEVVSWFAATSPPITLPGGATYRLLAHVHGTGVYANVFGAFHDGTYIDVRP